MLLLLVLNVPIVTPGALAVQTHKTDLSFYEINKNMHATSRNIIKLRY